jgi:hypothetical protein
MGFSKFLVPYWGSPAFCRPAPGRPAKGYPAIPVLFLTISKIPAGTATKKNVKK